MTNIKLSKRMLAIANMIDKCNCVADIGCDHALLDIYLVQNKIASKAIASDIVKGALNQARKNIMINNITEIDLRLGDGLSTIRDDDKIDYLILSGLGIIKINQILKNGYNKLKNIDNIIIQSNTGISSIRESVCDLGYFISDETIVKDNKIIYVVIKFKKGSKKYSKNDLFFGPILSKKKDELYNEYYQSILNKNIAILNTIPKKSFFRRRKLKHINKLIIKKLH